MDANMGDSDLGLTMSEGYVQCLILSEKYGRK